MASRRLASSTITVVGPGSIGTLLAVRLAAGGAAVSVIDHRPDRAAAIAQSGLRLATDEGILHADVRASTEVCELPPAGVVLVCVKCHQLEEVGHELTALPRAATIICLQNGLGVVEALARGLGAAAAGHKVLRAVTYQAASPDTEGLVRHVANLPTLFDGAGANRPEAERAACLFEEAGLPARAEADLRPTIWRKLVANMAINPLTALAHVLNGELVERADLRTRLETVARETSRVARAEGVAMSDDEAVSLAVEAARATAKNISSMRQDVEAGRTTEMAFLGGAMLRLAEAWGIDVPAIADAVRAIGEIDARNR